MMKWTKANRLVVGAMGALILLMLAACAGNGQAREEPAADVRAEKVSVPEYREFLVDLREAVSEGIPREFNQREMDRFNRLDSRLTGLLDGVDSVDELSRDERLALFNTHEELQALMSGRQDDQIICRRERTVGTHFQTEKCYTRREWREASEDSRRFIEDHMKAPVLPERN